MSLDSHAPRSQPLAASFRCAFSGLGWALRSQRNLRIHLAATLLAGGLGLFLGLSIQEWLILLLCAGAVWTAELFNTAFETLCDRVTTAPDEAVRRVKDTAAGAVLITALTALGIGCLIFLPKLLALWNV